MERGRRRRGGRWRGRRRKEAPEVGAPGPDRVVDRWFHLLDLLSSPVQRIAAGAGGRSVPKNQILRKQQRRPRRRPRACYFAVCRRCPGTRCRTSRQRQPLTAGRQSDEKVPPTSRHNGSVTREVDVDADDWQEAIRELATFDRPSASDGERLAAELIGARLRALGCDVSIEQESAHGGYWWPIGLANGWPQRAPARPAAPRPRGRAVVAALTAGVGAQPCGTTSVTGVAGSAGRCSRGALRGTSSPRLATDPRSGRCSSSPTTTRPTRGSSSILRSAESARASRRRCTSARATRSRSCTGCGSGLWPFPPGRRSASGRSYGSGCCSPAAQSQR